MWSSLILFHFAIFIVADQTTALYGENAYQKHVGLPYHHTIPPVYPTLPYGFLPPWLFPQHGNHSYILPSKISYTVDFASSNFKQVTIQTPGYPYKYPGRNQEIEWNIKTTTPIELYCPVFMLRPRDNEGDCSDYLEILGDSHPEKYCGNSQKGETLKILPRLSEPSNDIVLTFNSVSKPNYQFKGFKCIITPVPEEPQQCNCGVYTAPISPDPPKLRLYVIGGINAKENQVPWQAAMVWYNTTFVNCGGSVINDRYILTAAHCTDGVAPSDIQILLGVQCWNNTPPALEKLRLDVIKIIQHSGYNDDTIDNDISLVKLEERIDFVHTHFSPVCIPITNTDPVPVEDDVKTAISGFGSLASGGDFPDCLQYAEVPTMNNTLCQHQYRIRNKTITNNMICAGFPGVGGIDTCQGDSGGPMVANATSNTGGNYSVQVGIVSWGIGCADPQFPGVYARVSAYIDWIKDNTEESTTCPPP